MKYSILLLAFVFLLAMVIKNKYSLVLTNVDLIFLVIILIIYSFFKLLQVVIISYNFKVASFEILNDWYLLIILCYLFFYKIFK